jgi:hypothetical protein
MGINVNEVERVFYLPGSAGILDAVTDDGRGVYGGQSLEEIRADHPSAVVLDFDQAIEEIDKVNRARFLTPPVEISMEHYDVDMGVFPPEAFTTGKGWGGFRFMEYTCERWTAHYCHIGKRYFTGIRRAGAGSVRAFVDECRGIVEKEATLSPEVFKLWHELESVKEATPMKRFRVTGIYQQRDENAEITGDFAEDVTGAGDFAEIAQAALMAAFGPDTLSAVVVEATDTPSRYNFSVTFDTPGICGNAELCGVLQIEEGGRT